MIRLRSLLTLLSTHPVPLSLLVAVIFFGAHWMSAGTVQLVTFVLIATIFAQSINLLTGLAGQVSLGHAGFFAIGAYTSGILAKTYHLEILLSVPAGAATALVSAYLLSFPARRVRELYLAMMTLGFGMISYEIVRGWDDVTGGTMGLTGVPSTTLRSLAVMGLHIDAVQYLRILLAVTVLLLWLLRNLTQSRVGRALFAIQYSELAAGSIGISPEGMKQLAYALSGGLAGLAGGFYAHLVGYLGPESFGLSRSIEVLVISIVGGMGSIAGQAVSAAFFTFLPERLQGFAEYQFIAYGIILTFSLIALPRGIAGLLFNPPRFIKRAALRRTVSDGTIELGQAVEEGPRGGALAVSGITVRFGGLTALDNVALRLAPGSVTALVGPNGSGKSTLVNVMSGICQPSGGTVLFDGHDITGQKDFRVARAGLVRTFQDPRLVPHFTVRENLLLGAHRLLRHSGLAAVLALPSALDEEARCLASIDAILRFTGLTDVAERTMAELPYGTNRFVEVGRALLSRPRAILLDEPAAGLSEVEMERLGKLLRDMKKMGLTILLIEHHMDILEDLVDEVVVLDSGRIIYQGDFEGMRRDRGVITAYLGEEALAVA